MNEVLLCSALRQRIKDAVEQLEVPHDLSVNGSLPGIKSARVVNAFLPPKRSDDIPDFPFVLVRPSKGKSTGNDSTCTVKILIGAYSEEYDEGGHIGYEYAMLLNSAIRRSLFDQPILDNVFMFNREYDWQLSDEQPYPEWILEAKAVYSVATQQNTQFEESI